MAKAEPNVVPLCDVLLVLLIIFMVITPMVQKGIDVRLPEVASEGGGGQPAGLIVVTLKNDLQIDINNQLYPDLRAAGDALRALYATRTDKTIFLRADMKSPFARVVDLIDVCKGAGIDTLGLVPEFIDEK